MITDTPLLLVPLIVSVSYLRNSRKGLSTLLLLSPIMKSLVATRYILTSGSFFAVALTQTVLSLFGGKLKFTWTPAFWVLLVFFAYMEVRVIESMALSFSLRLLNLFCFYPSVFLFILFFGKSVPIGDFSERFFILILWGSLFTLAALILVNEIIPPGSVRKISLGTIHNVYSGIGGSHRASVIYFIPFTLGAIHAPFFWRHSIMFQIKYRIIAFITAILLSIVLINMESRASILSIILFSIWLIFFKNVQKPLLIMFIPCFALLFFIFFYKIWHVDFIKFINNYSHSDNYIFETRSISFFSGIELLKEHFWFGIGIGKFESLGFSKFLSIADSLKEGYSDNILRWRDGANPGTGSMHYYYLVETGFIGFVLYMSVVVLTTKKLWLILNHSLPTRRYGYNYLLSAWITMFVHLTFVTGDMYILFWLMVAFAFHHSENTVKNFGKKRGAYVRSS